MTGARGCEPRRTRVLPAAVFSLFALIIVADLVVVVFYGNYRNLVEEEGIEISFEPTCVTSDGGADDQGRSMSVPEAGRLVDPEGTVLVDRADDRLVVHEPGAIVIRFRAPNAGGRMEFDYRFGERQADARCEVVVARVASQYGVDVVRRKDLTAARKVHGKFKHNLADHAGWFRLSLQVNPAAAGDGFEVALPTIDCG